jgi:hypothetical protein
MSPRLLILLSTALLASGCQVTTQLGAECTLVRKATAEEKQTNGGLNFVTIKESELVNGQDFISFGALDCDQLELTCVRDAAHPRRTEQGSAAAETTDALGYCSQACVEHSSSCEVVESEVSEGLKGREVECRSLALDQQALEQLKKDDPVAYRQTFGENNSPFFCAAKLVK